MSWNGTCLNDNECSSNFYCESGKCLCQSGYYLTNGGYCRKFFVIKVKTFKKIFETVFKRRTDWWEVYVMRHLSA